MVKVKGINIFPQAIGPLLEEHAAFAGEFICKATRDDTGREEFIVAAEVRERSDRVANALQELLKRKLGIAPVIELVDVGALAPLTQTEVRQKPIRLIDERFK